MSGLDWEVRAYHHHRRQPAFWTLGHAAALGLALGAFAGILTALALL